jgi:hypothetical protein
LTGHLYCRAVDKARQYKAGCASFLALREITAREGEDPVFNRRLETMTLVRIKLGFPPARPIVRDNNVVLIIGLFLEVTGWSLMIFVGVAVACR